MRKPKATTKSLKAEIQKMQEEHLKFREKVRAYILAACSTGSRRPLMTIEPANKEGKINGMTIPELVMLVNLSKATFETVLLETTNQEKDLYVVAKKQLPSTPWELL